MKLQPIISILLPLIFELSSCTHLMAIPGSTLELPCLLYQRDLFGASITWTFNEIDVGEQPLRSLGVRKGGLYLLISPVSAANMGTYVCLVKENNVEMRNQYSITVEASVNYTMTALEGSTVQLPCHFPPDRKVLTNALWFKETVAGQRIALNLDDDSTDNNTRMTLLYPYDMDQSVLLTDVAMEDAGTYYCKSSEGDILTTLHFDIEAAPTPAPLLCKDLPVASESCQDDNSRTGERILPESMAEFSMKLYSYLRQSAPSSNLLFSPISIVGMFSHLLLGARDDTHRAIERAVCVPHDFHCIHFQMKNLREKLASSLEMASQIYHDPQINLRESFKNQSIEFYEAEPTALLEDGEENAEMINTWVATKTKNKITHLVDYISPSTQLILLNAVSFRGQWNLKFDVKPKHDYFTKLNGDMVPVPVLYHKKYTTSMMHVTQLRAQVARFGLSGNTSLYILLPRSNRATDLQQLEELMTDRAVHRMIVELQKAFPQQVEVTLPKIKLDVESDMHVIIKKLGLSSLFEGANLCGLYSERKLVLDDVRHKAFLSLTEEGVEAAAVTSATFSRSYPSFSALRPFIMLLWSDQANVPLFVGRLTEP